MLVYWFVCVCVRDNRITGVYELNWNRRLLNKMVEGVKDFNGRKKIWYVLYYVIYNLISKLLTNTQTQLTIFVRLIQYYEVFVLAGGVCLNMIRILLSNLFHLIVLIFGKFVLDFSLFITLFSIVFSSWIQTQTKFYLFSR